MTLDARADEARTDLVRFVMAHGCRFDVKVLDLRGPAGDCWTHAWDVARADPTRAYVEGVCLLRGQTHAHAWTIDLAGVVYEHTEGYERAGVYIGFPMDLTPGSEALRLSEFVERTVIDGSPRCSLIEGLLANGVPFHVIAHNLGGKP